MLTRILWHYRQAMKQYRLPRRELQELQAKKLRRTLQFSYDYVPLYHEWFRSIDMKPEQIRTKDDLARLPFLTKETVQKNYPERITVKGARKGTIRQTSGSTSRPLQIRRPPMYADIQTGLKLRKVRMGGERLWARGAVFQFPYSPYYDGRQTVWGPSALTTILFGQVEGQLPVIRLKKVIYNQGYLGDASRALYRFRPDVVDAKSIILRHIGHYLRDQGLQVKVRTGFIGEVRTAACRRDLTQLFKMENIIHTYGAAEFGYLGSECTEHSGIHLSSDYYLFETLRVEEIAAPGERGELVVTGFDNEAMPLIRYKLGDIVIEAEEENALAGPISLG